MTNEEAIRLLIEKIKPCIVGTEWDEAIDMAIEALSANYITEKPNDIVEQKNDIVAKPTDLISRKELLDRIKAINSIPWGDEHGNAVKLVWSTEEVKRLIEKAPSSDRPSGEWIIRENGNKECSLCGHERQDGWDYFCGYCGAKMGSGGLYYADNRLTVEWKLASEELPQKVGSYIVTCKDEYGQVYVDYDYWTVADEFKYNRAKVTAWIPFPKPYCGAKMGSDAR